MRTASRRAAAVAASLALVLGLSACGGDDSDEDADNGADSEIDQGDQAGDGTDEGDATSGTGVAMSGFAFEPSDITVAAGSAIPLDNQDSATHSFTIQDTDVDVEVGGGESGEATAPDEPGDYEFVCRFHSGMRGTLTVE